MLQEAPAGAAEIAQRNRTNRLMTNPETSQGRSAGGTVGQQGDQLPQQQPLQRLQNHLNMKQGQTDPVRPVQPQATPPTAPATATPGAFGTPFDSEIGEIDLNDPEAVQDLMTRMNQAIVDNQASLDKQDAAAQQGLPAPNQDKLGRMGGQLGKQRNYMQSQQM